MQNKKTKSAYGDPQDKNSNVPLYVPPLIVSYTSDKILEMVGPARACVDPHGCSLSYSS